MKTRKLETQSATAPAPAAAIPGLPAGLQLVDNDSYDWVDFELQAFTRRELQAADGTSQGDVVIDVVLTNEASLIERDGYCYRLSHDKGAIDMRYARNGLALLLEHGNTEYFGRAMGIIDPKLHLGVVENVTHDEAGKKLLGSMRFSKKELAQEVMREFEDKTRKYVSAGIVKNSMVLVREAKGSGDLPEYRVTNWMPVELSAVSIPADPRAKTKQSIGGGGPTIDAQAATSRKEPTMTPEEEAAAKAAAAKAAAPAPPPASRETQTAVLDRDDVAAIAELCASHGMADKTAEFLRQGLSKADVGLRILELKKDASPKVPAGTAEGLDLSKKEAQAYSVQRAIQMQVEMQTGRKEYDGIEGELHKELVRLAPASMERHGGILIPMRFRKNADQDRELARERQAMGSGVPGAGAEIVFDRPGDLIDMLVNRALVAKFGAQIYSGLTNPIPFPKQTADVDVQWMQENPPASATASQMGFGTILLSPKTLIGTVPMPRQLLALASIDVENRSKQRLVGRHGIVLDRAALHGPGTDRQPTGIYNTPGVTTTAFGSVPPTYPKLVDMESAIADLNADGDSMAYMTTPKLAGKLKQTVEFSAAGAIKIWTGKLRDGEVNGYPAGATKQVSGLMSGLADTGGAEQGIIFGDWSQIVIGLWGAMEIVTDIYSLADKGQVKVTTFQMCDIACLRPESFNVATAATLA